MLRIMHVEEIADLLLLTPGLVRQRERRCADFEANVGNWLNSLEGVFTASRLHQAGSIAMLRSALVAAEQGEVRTGLVFQGRPSRSRVLQAVALEALQRAVDVASSLMAENQPRLAEAERVARQIIAAALSRDLINAREEKMNNTAYLRALRRSFATSTDLESAAVHLEGLVGPHDALILFDRALEPHLDTSSRTPQSVTFSSSG